MWLFAVELQINLPALSALPLQRACQDEPNMRPDNCISQIQVLLRHPLR